MSSLPADTRSPLARLHAFFFWSAKEKAHLGLGTVLYLNALRWMFMMFGVIFLLSIPNILINEKGPRYTFDSLNGDYLAFASTHLSIANLGSQEWTPTQPLACNNNGFSAKVCVSWSSSAIDEYDYSCGFTPPGTSLTSIKSFSILSGEVNVVCESVKSICHCFEGFSGEKCENVANASLLINKSVSGKVIKSWCTSPINWWEAKTFSKRAELYEANRILRVNNVCNGRGSCFTRTSTDDITLPLFSFCQCDRGYYGPYCETQVAATDTYGSVFNVGVGNNDSTAISSCNLGALPAIERTFVFSLPPAICSSHGFGLYMPTKPDGSLNVSNAYRVQSRGVCLCEPGYSGEECLGGEPIPDLQGYLMCVHALFMAIVCCLLHQHRKTSEQAVDDSNVSPRDFSIFVNHLPVLKSSKPIDIQRVRKHFEQFGPVYSVVPATNDENIFYFQREQNLALLALQKMVERQAFAERKKGIINATMNDAPKQRTDTAASTDWKIRPVWYPRLSPLVESKIRDSCVLLEPLTAADCVGVDPPAVEASWDSLIWLIRPLCWNVALLDFMPMGALRALIRNLEGLLDVELKNPENFNFERAFVTFEHQASRDSCLSAYGEMARWSTRPSGEYAFTDGKTKKRITVNVRFPKVEGDATVSLIEGLGKSFQRAIGSPTKLPAAENAEGKSEASFYPSDQGDTTLEPLTSINPLSSLGTETTPASSDSISQSSSSDSKSQSASSAPWIGRRRVSKIATTRAADPSKSTPIKVSLAWEPDEVVWDALDTSPQELMFRGIAISLYMFAVVFILFIVITTVNAKKETGTAGFLISLGVVLLNFAIATHWYSIADMEQNYSIGQKSRSIYIKVLCAQIAVTILSGTIGVYGYPVDTKNGYVQDWYAEAGGFLFNTVIIETFLPPLLLMMPMKWINMKLTEYTSGYTSYTEWMSMRLPPPFALESRCASLVRTVILCCAFQSGLPVLNIACAVCLFIRYVADMYAMEYVCRIQRSGAELARALEVSLILSTLLLSCMSWVLLRAGQATTVLHVNAEIVFFICLVFILWALSGYLSFKRFQKRDCCLGFGFSMIPKSFPNPLLLIHEMYMRLVFGDFFFNEYDDTFDETGGKTYSELSKVAQKELLTGYREDGSVVKQESLSSHFLMRTTPYGMKEREQQLRKTGAAFNAGAGQYVDSIPYPPDWTALHMKIWLEEIRKRGRATAGADEGSSNASGRQTA